MYCIKCGTQNSDDAVFCQRCGYKFDLEEETRVAVRGDKAVVPSEPIFSISPTLMFVRGGYVLTVIAAFLLVALFGMVGISWPIAVVIGVLLLLVPAYFHLRQKMVRYSLTETTIEIDKGLISRSTQNVPLRRIQDVTVSSSFIQRLLGFGDIVIDNASETGGKVILDNIDSPRKYADLLLEQMRRLDR
ncbi:MAG: PH domain-containing protein [Acidobacteria bacterium]|nr:PH domain-containing protein [Acidobacteriota bacterium]